MNERHRNKEKSFGKYRGEAIGAIIWNLVWLWIINNVQDWNLSFILSSFGVLLWIWNINVAVQILTNLGIVILELRWFRYLMKALMESANFVSIIATFYLYPFDFSGLTGWGLTDMVIQICLVIAMVFTAISVIVQLWKMIFWR